jgi:hypothetical protein
VSVVATIAKAKKPKKKKKPVRCVVPKSKRAKGKKPKPLTKRQAAKYCKPVKKKKPVKKPAPARAPVPLAPPLVVAPQPGVTPPAPPPVLPDPATSPLAIYPGPFGIRQAERLLWRAGFGPRPGQAKQLADLGLARAVGSLTRPRGEAVLTGPEPTDGHGGPLLYPEDIWGQDLLWWLDRMVRTDQPLVERMTLVLHDWFATSNAGVASQKLMVAQNRMMRSHALGSFKQLVLDMTVDPAMMWWLNLLGSTKDSPNENYARELMELFTLGADRGAYTEADVRAMARAFTGWVWHYDPVAAIHTPRIDASGQDAGVKTIFGKSGNFDWQDACELCIEHPLHPSFFVNKLWSYFIPTPASEADRVRLEQLYVDSGYSIASVLEAILLHPAFYTGEDIVKPPAVFLAGLLRNQGMGVTNSVWVVFLDQMEQRLFYPPDVSGWDDARWLNTSTLRARWSVVSEILKSTALGGTAASSYSTTETPQQAVDAARLFWGDPPLTTDTLAALLRFAEAAIPATGTIAQKSIYRAQRQNGLRQLIAFSPDAQWC